MSNAHTIIIRGIVPVIIALAGLMGATAVQAQGIKDVLNQKKIAAQKLEGEVQQALDKARKQEKTNPGSAINLLQTYKFVLENDENLTKERRAELLRHVTQRISQLERLPQLRTDVATPPLPKKSAKELLRDKYRKGGSIPTPRPSDVASKFIDSTRNRLAYDRDMKFRIRNGRLDVLNGIDKGLIPPKGDFEYPSYWKQLKKMRKRFSGPQLTPQEAALMKAMNSVLTVSYDGTPLKFVLEDLRKRTGQTIIADANALKEVGVDYSTTVSLKGEKLRVRTVLKTITRQLGLAYILQDGIVQIVTQDVARNTMTVRGYPLGALVTPDPRLGTYFNLARQQYFANQIMQLIVTTVDPTSWAINGGQGTIWYDQVSQSILVRQSAELHLPVSRALGSGLGR